MLGYPDGNLATCRGAFFANGTRPRRGAGRHADRLHAAACGRSGPTRVFLPTSADLHPDHRIVHEEFLISLFHAQGGIWPELGKPIAEVPRIYEMADLLRFPRSRRRSAWKRPEAMLETKLEAIMAYASQEQIATVVEIQRAVGPVEYLREVEFPFLLPQAIRRTFRREHLMLDKICYLGDDHLQGAAAYLAGILLHHGLAFDYVPSGESPPRGFRLDALRGLRDQRLPGRAIGRCGHDNMAARVEQGAGLVMLGGWESFHGRLGEYHQSPLAAVLPVTMQSCDDRRNFAQPCLIEKVRRTRNPGRASLGPAPGDRRHQPGGGQAGGGNAARRRRSSPCSRTERAYKFVACPRQAPLLVVGRHGAGRTAALATDVAPHWVGGLVDWGDRRIVQEVGGGSIEVGNWYARFFRNLVAWAGVERIRSGTSRVPSDSGPQRESHHCRRNMVLALGRHSLV